MESMSRNCLIWCSRLTLIATVMFFPATIGFAGGSQTTLTLTSSANPAVLGQPVTLTAVVSPGDASGKVTFYSGITILGTGPVAKGTASLTTRFQNSGTLPLKAIYSGDANYTLLAQTFHGNQ
jgi:hypothetical protein